MSLLLSLKRTARSVALCVKAATGATFGGGASDTVMFWEALSVAPSSSVAVSVIVNVPSTPYVWLGCCWTDVSPSPKSQDQATTEPSPSVLVSVKAHAKESQFTENDAVGAWFVGAPIRSAIAV